MAGLILHIKPFVKFGIQMYELYSIIIFHLCMGIYNLVLIIEANSSFTDKANGYFYAPMVPFEYRMLLDGQP